MLCQASFAMKNREQLAKEGGEAAALLQQPRLRTKHKWCRNWTQSGKCRWADKCSFAHFESDFGQPRQLQPAVDESSMPNVYDMVTGDLIMAEEVVSSANPQTDFDDDDAVAPFHPH